MSARFENAHFEKTPIVAILRGLSPGDCAEVVEAALRGGLTNVEVTMNSDDAEGQIRAACKVAGSRANVGAGTVLSLDDLERALAAGASYIVTPALLPAIIAECVRRKVPVMPAGFTPTEIWSAWQAGAHVVKVFPAEQLGPRYLKNLRGPFPRVRLMPTGGVDVSTIAEWHAAGAVAFGVGSAVFSPKAVATRDWGRIESDSRALVEAYRKLST